jgi:hypothetical protein
MVKRHVNPVACVALRAKVHGRAVPVVTYGAHLRRLPKRRFLLKRFSGSAQESVETRILRGFTHDDEFGPEGGHSLSFQQQVTKIFVSAASA